MFSVSYPARDMRSNAKYRRNEATLAEHDPSTVREKQGQDSYILLLHDCSIECMPQHDDTNNDVHESQRMMSS